jgi:hypothetical protein
MADSRETIKGITQQGHIVQFAELKEPLPKAIPDLGQGSIT